jgi:hypothetical protein
MKRWLTGWFCAVCVVHAVCADGASAQWFGKKTSPAASASIPWQDLNERASGIAQQMVEKPTVFARGPSETFACNAEQYFWLLDNPDRVVLAWRRLGAKCVNITRRGPGRFGYNDDQGSDVSWETIHQSPSVRLWFAEGKVKGTAALPMVPVKALVVLRHTEGKSPEGKTIMQHQAEVILHTDSKAAALVTKMMGQSATRLTEQGLGQLQLFFSALSSYLERHPDRAEALFRTDKAPVLQQTSR